MSFCMLSIPIFIIMMILPPLDLAVLRHNPKMVNLILNACRYCVRTNPNNQNSHRATPLLIAFKDITPLTPTIVRSLMDQGADASIPDDRGITPPRFVLPFVQ